MAAMRPAVRRLDVAGWRVASLSASGGGRTAWSVGTHTLRASLRDQLLHSAAQTSHELDHELGQGFEFLS